MALFRMKKEYWITLAGLGTSLAGFVLTLAQNWVSEQQMNQMIDEKIEEALAKRDKEAEEA